MANRDWHVGYVVPLLVVVAGHLRHWTYSLALAPPDTHVQSPQANHVQRPEDMAWRTATTTRRTPITRTRSAPHSSATLLRHSLRSHVHVEPTTRLTVTLQAPPLLVGARVRLGGSDETCYLNNVSIDLVWTFIMACMDYYYGLYGLYGLYLWTLWTTMDCVCLSYGLYALLM
jgi:hypothetical protein